MQLNITKRQKPIDYYFVNNTFQVEAPELCDLLAKQNKNMGSPEAYLIKRKTYREIRDQGLEHILQEKKRNVNSIYGFDGLYNLIFKEDKPSAKSVALVLRSTLFKGQENIIFTNGTQFYVLGQDGCYQKFEKEIDLVSLLKKKFWQLSIYGLETEQKNVEAKDYEFYPIRFKELCTKKFILEVADFFVTSIPTCTALEFRKILEWQEGKLLFNNKVVDLKTGSTTFLDSYTNLQGLCKTGLDYPVPDMKKIKFLVKQIIVTYGRSNTNRFLYFLLLCFKGTLKEQKLIGVSSGPRNSGSTVLQVSLKNGLGSCVSTRNGEAILFKQASKIPENARHYAIFRDLFALLYIVTDYPVLPVDTDSLKSLTGGESFDARSLFNENSEIPFFLACVFFVGNPRLNVVEPDVQSTFVTFVRARIILPTLERIATLLALGFPKRQLRLANDTTAGQLKKQDYAVQWVHVLDLFRDRKTVFGKQVYYKQDDEKLDPPPNFPALQSKTFDDDYWSFLDLTTQIGFIIENHFCITRHPQDWVALPTLSAIFGHYSFSRRLPTFDDWKKYLKENVKFKDTMVGPKQPNTGKTSHEGPTKSEQTFYRQEINTEKKNGTQKVFCIRGLRLRNEANGFQDESFHSESYPPEAQDKYKTDKKAYVQKRETKIKNFAEDYQYSYVPQVLDQKTPPNIGLKREPPSQREKPTPVAKKPKIEHLPEPFVL